MAVMVLLAIALWSSPLTAQEWRGRVENILDGDTLEIRADGADLRSVRLYGVDAPKLGQYFALNAQDFLWHLVYRHNVLVIPMDIAPDGQVVAILNLQGLFINKEMIRSGHARFNPHSCFEEPFCAELSELEKIAIFYRWGLWAPPPPPPPPPRPPFRPYPGPPPPWWYWHGRW